MITAISIFFQYFGFFSLIGLIVMTILIQKELKKQLPTQEEKDELIRTGKISADCKNKKILRTATQELRVTKQFEKKYQEYVDSIMQVKK